MADDISAVDAALLAEMQQQEQTRKATAIARICASLKQNTGQFHDVYPLQSDSRWFMRALADRLDDIRFRDPALIVEVGCGASPAAALLARLLPEVAVFATDVSQTAMRASSATARTTDTSLHLARMDLLSAWRDGTVDLLVFLPPYVPTSEAALADAMERVAQAATPVAGMDEAVWVWGGGPKGTALLERLVAEDLGRVLSRDGIALMLFPSDAEDVGMVERASNGVLTATIVARCDEPELTHLCVIQVERLE